MMMPYANQEQDQFARVVKQGDKQEEQVDPDTWRLLFYIFDALATLTPLVGMIVLIVRLVMFYLNGEDVTTFDIIYTAFSCFMFFWKISTNLASFIMVLRNEKQSLKDQRIYFQFSLYVGTAIDGAIIILVAIILLTMKVPDYKDIIVAYLIVILVFVFLNAAFFFMAMLSLLMYIDLLKKSDLVSQSQYQYQYQPVLSNP